MNHKYIKVGITGHRYGVNELIYKKLFAYLKTYIVEYHFTIDTIVSPLADGTDRIVALELMNQYGAKLIVPLPFEIDSYKKTILSERKEEFELLLQRASNVVQLSSLYQDSKEVGYLRAGKYVVDHCDLLIVVWDGKVSQGLGGTADIVMYAKSKKRNILYINTLSGEIVIWR